VKNSEKLHFRLSNKSPHVFSHAIGKEIMLSCGFPVSVINAARNLDDPTAGTRVFKKTSKEAKIKPIFS